jgi:hypothetical protein
MGPCEFWQVGLSVSKSRGSGSVNVLSNTSNFCLRQFQLGTENCPEELEKLQAVLKEWRATVESGEEKTVLKLVYKDHIYWYNI